MWQPHTRTHYKAKVTLGQEGGWQQVKEPGAWVVAGFQMSVGHTNILQDCRTQSCCVRTHWNRKNYTMTLHNLAAAGVGGHGKRREPCPGNRHDTGLAIGNIFWFILRNLTTNLSNILRFKDFFFPLNDLFSWRETHNHQKNLHFFSLFFF